MGKKWNRKRKKDDKKRKANKQSARRDGSSWISSNPGNAKMESYYALQGLHDYSYNNENNTFVKCNTNEEKEVERMKWLTSLRTMLPASFRIGMDVDPALRERLEYELDSHFVEQKVDIVVEEGGVEEGGDKKEQSTTKNKTTTKSIAPARRIPFIPHAYQMSVDRKTIRRHPVLREFHEWLTTQTSCGNITRQETVSMIPPIVLNVQPHHLVLDMCAAPGSKTSQLLEVVSTSSNSGCVVANDSDPKRAYMLVHQLKRINSPAVLVTSCDAQFFPQHFNKNKKSEGMFDAVLADVPCSGDGTARKNPGVWKQWSALGSLSLHPLQLAIALNGANLLKVGGMLCYSTCAMSPIENEAIVAELLRASDGALELVDKRSDLPGLVARPGWNTWRVLRESKSRKQIKDYEKKNNAKMQEKRKEWEEKNGGDVVMETTGATANGGDVEMDTTTNGNNAEKIPEAPSSKKAEASSEQVKKKNDNEKRDHSGGPPPSWDEETLLARAAAHGLQEFKSFDEVPEEWKRSVRKTCFPPTEEEAAKFGLEKCLRCLPQDMDTGGFFVALLKKVSPMSAKAKKEAEELAKEFREDTADGTADVPPPTKRAKTEATEEEIESNSEVPTETNETEMETDSQLDDTTDAGKTECKDSKQPAKEGPTGRSLLGVRGKNRGDLGKEGFVPVSEDTWAPLEEFYGFTDTFPKDQYMARADSKAKALYFLSAPVKDLIDRGIQERVTIINSGLKGFSRCSKDCKVTYRVAQEGIQHLAPHMTKRKIAADVDDFSKCIETGNIRLEIFSDEFANEVRKLDPGSFVVTLKGHDDDVLKKMFLVMWRCRKDAIDCLIAKVEQNGLKSKLRAITGNDANESVAAKGTTSIAADGSTS